MRRVLIFSAVVGVVFAAFARAQEMDTSNSAPVGPHISVVAEGISARALAVTAQNSLLVSTVNPADRFFALGSSAGSPGIAGSPSLVPIAGDGEPGFLGDGGAATAAQLDLASSAPYERSGIAVTSDGSVFIADTHNQTIREIAGPSSSEPGVVRSVAGRWGPRPNESLAYPLGLAADRVGNLFIADKQAGSIEYLDAATGVLSAVAQITAPSNVAVNHEGTIAFVSSSETGAVYSINLKSHSLAAIKVVNQLSGVSTTDVPACSAQSQRVCPAGLAIDGAGNLFVSDLTFNRILRLDAHTGAASIALVGLKQPGAIAFDPSGRDLYIVEQGQNRIIVALNSGSPLSTLSVSPSSSTFANEPVGGISPQQQFTVTNNSNATVSGLTITSPSGPQANGNFSLESTSCASNLAAQATCAVNVSFTPTTVASNLSSTVSASDSGGNSASAPISGTGDDFQLQLAANQSQEMSVVPGQSVTFKLQAAASGVFGQNGEQVAITCPNGTPAHSTCTVTPATVSPTPGSPASFTVTIQTSSTVVSAGSLFARPSAPGITPSRVALFIFVLGMAALLICAPRSRRTAFGFGLVFVALLFNGCHHASQLNLATPLGSTQLLIQGSALAHDGTSLNASRGATIIVDVVAK